MVKGGFIVKARKFIKEHKLKGPSGFLKFVILNYVEAINMVSDEFIFKGGNLIWFYINTPRGTIDLDFSTIGIDSHEEVKKILNKASKKINGITYNLENFVEVKRQNHKGASAVIKYKTEDGASNKFEIDIVYALETELKKLSLNLSPEKNSVLVASIENIITDKIDTSHRFRSGNTRMKDFDDLYRFATGKVKFDKKKIKKFMKLNDYEKVLDETWISEEMSKAWKIYSKKYENLPDDILIVFKAINNKLLS
jgi:hypothetical protein